MTTSPIPEADALGAAAPRPQFDIARVRPAAMKYMREYHADVVRAVAAAIARDEVVVVGMAQNPHVKNVRRALKDAGVEFTYLEYGSYLSGWHDRLAIKLWSGWPTFPQVFVGGELVGGEDLTIAAIKDGSLRPKVHSGSAG